MDMTIVVVTEAQQMALESLTKARERLEEAHRGAVAANETMFESLILNDTESDDLDLRIAAEEKNWKCEAEAERAWNCYEKCLIRYRWELEQAKKAGIINQQ